MRIVLFGAGGSTIVEVEETCVRLGIEIAAIVRNVAGADRALGRDRVVDADDADPALTALPYSVPIFTPGHRLAAQRDADRRGYEHPATIVDPTAIVAGSAAVAVGGFINAGAIIGAASRLGAWVFVNRGASVGHHVEIGEFVALGPGAIVCGETRLGRGAVIAAGAVVLPGIEVGANSTLAAGSVLRESLADHCLAAGNPARVVRRDYPGFRRLSV